MMQDFCFARKVFGEDFLYERHVNYLLKSLKKSTYGAPLEVAEAHRLSSLFFVISGLDLLGALDTRLTQTDKENTIQWIYSYQVDINRILIPRDLLHPDDEVKDISVLDAEVKEREYQSRYALIDNNSNSNTQTNNHQYNQVPNDQCNNHHLLNNHQSYIHRNHQQSQPSPFSQRAKHITLSRRVGHAGFRATSMMNSDIPLDFGVLPMTYCALATLVILGDDLKGVDKDSILKGMRQLQSSDGSFRPTIFGGETDMRLVYCAAAVSKLLNDWSGMDRDKCAKFIKNSLTYEGAFGQCPGAEAHGGSTYCALASLKLMSKLDETLTKEEIDRLIRWCLMRFENGFCGRPNKDEDTCYSFWIGACLVMLEHFEFIEQKNLLDFILMAQEERGGLAKVPDFYSDPIHTYLGFAGLTFIDDDLSSKRGVNLLKLDPILNISARARAYLDKLQGITKNRDSVHNKHARDCAETIDCTCIHMQDVNNMDTTKDEQIDVDDDDSGKDEDDGEDVDVAMT